ncbi:MAG: tRNA (guanosine(37)-N1)-methyltransferase TrmD [Gammaproteobacteria bacterium]|nr:tRNA (guanosine(37)-N1)-methyltransferase TrmD [Gammaproteobacteria bacterium]MCP5202052.1 tRNA (guanosine(37)-N1)-methyltransferase TrmD [Gammaproteobacteria bacterium]
MQFTVVTLFPELIDAFGDVGIVGRSRARGLVDIATVNPRDFAADRRGTVDDAPYGGGPGMVMMVTPLRRAIAAARARSGGRTLVAYLSPQGRRFEQALVAELAAYDHLVLLAGRYEGIDERVIERDVDCELSVGDFIVSGGEVPAMLVIDAITRTLPGALGDARSAVEDSFSDGLLDHPHYTRPEVVDGDAVPPVLLSGDHGAIAAWRRDQRLARTRARRPDLLAAGGKPEPDPVG